MIYNTGAETSTKSPISHSAEVVASLIELIAIKHPLKVLGIPAIILIISSIYFGVNAISLFNETRYFSLPLTFITTGTGMIGSMMLLISILLYSISKNYNSR